MIQKKLFQVKARRRRFHSVTERIVRVLFITGAIAAVFSCDTIINMDNTNTVDHDNPLANNTSVPVVTGIFIAPEISSDAGLAEWISSLQAMKTIGINTVIVQYSFQTDAIYGTQAYFEPFPQQDTALYPERRRQIGRILHAARAADMQVYLGLQIAEREWFDGNMYRDYDWLYSQYRLSTELADALWSAFGDDYAGTVAGWYLPFEFESSAEYHDYFHQITDVYYRPVTAYLKDSFDGLPVIISPLMYAYDDKDRWRNSLITVLAGAQIDIIAPQDGIGYGTQTHATVGDWYATTDLAVKYVNETSGKSISLWGNCENYMHRRDYNDALESIKPMSIGKFINSLHTVAPYVDNLITFSIHRWDACMNHNVATGINSSYYEAYKTYYLTKEIPESKAAGYYVRISSPGTLTFHEQANAGLTDGFAVETDNWQAYKGVNVSGAQTFTMEIRFDDPVDISSIKSHYYQDSPSEIVWPKSVAYEYLVRSGPDDDIYNYYSFGNENRLNSGSQTASTAQRAQAVTADGVRITVQIGGSWTFLDEIWVE